MNLEIYCAVCKHFYEILICCSTRLQIAILQDTCPASQAYYCEKRKAFPLKGVQNYGDLFHKYNIRNKKAMTPIIIINTNDVINQKCFCDINPVVPVNIKRRLNNDSILFSAMITLSTLFQNKLFITLRFRYSS